MSTAVTNENPFHEMVSCLRLEFQLAFEILGSICGPYRARAVVGEEHIKLHYVLLDKEGASDAANLASEHRQRKRDPDRYDLYRSAADRCLLLSAKAGVSLSECREVFAEAQARFSRLGSIIVHDPKKCDHFEKNRWSLGEEVDLIKVACDESLACERTISRLMELSIFVSGRLGEPAGGANLQGNGGMESAEAKDGTEADAKNKTAKPAKSKTPIYNRAVKYHAKYIKSLGGARFSPRKFAEWLRALPRPVDVGDSEKFRKWWNETYKPSLTKSDSKR